MKHKGFTLIELLVVVAIIGILASVGVVAYSGYTSAAKKGVAKANHKSVTKYVSGEMMRCVGGASRILDNKVNCNSLTAQAFAQFVTAALNDFKNPYGKVDKKNDAGVKSGGAAYEDGELGYTIINTQGSDTFSFDTCFQKPCNKKDSNGDWENIISDSVTLN